MKGQADRYPTSNVTINMEITDIFEFLTLGAGTFKIEIKNVKTIHLRTVPLVRKKEKEIDKLLSSTLVEDE